MNVPNPDPNELFLDINEQLFGMSTQREGAVPTMSGLHKISEDSQKIIRRCRRGNHEEIKIYFNVCIYLNI